MTTIELTLFELGAFGAGTAALAVTDGAAISRLAIAYAAKRMGVQPKDIYRYDQATEGEQSG